MARIPDAELAIKKQEWDRKILWPDFREKSFKEQGEEIGVSGQTISNWRKEISGERWQQILDMTRKEAAAPTLEVDDALLRKAKGGDVGAMKLWYEIHGWSPRQINENVNKSEFDGLSASEKLAKAKEFAERIAGKVDLGVVGQKGAESGAGG